MLTMGQQFMHIMADSRFAIPIVILFMASWMMGIRVINRWSQASRRAASIKYQEKFTGGVHIDGDTNKAVFSTTAYEERRQRKPQRWFGSFLPGAKID